METNSALAEPNAAGLDFPVTALACRGLETRYALEGAAWEGCDSSRTSNPHGPGQDNSQI